MAHFPIYDMKSPAAIRALTFSVELKLFDVGKAEVDKKSLVTCTDCDEHKKK